MTADPGGPQPLRGNAPLSLRQAGGGAWRVTQGGVDLFSVDVADGRSQGARRHVLRLEPGAVIVAAEARVWPSQLDLLLVGTVDAQVQPLSALEMDREAVQVGRWAEALVRAVPGGCTEALEALRAALAMNPQAVATDASTPSLHATPFPPWRQALEEVHAKVLEQIALARLDARQSDAERLKARSGADADQFRIALARLEEVLEPDLPVLEPERETMDEPLVAACRLVCEAQGIDAALLDAMPPAAQQAASAALADPVATVARHWHLRVRRVLLTEHWYLQDCGPLVGFLEDGAPVALLPASARRYDIVVAPNGTRQRVDEAVAQGLRPHAYTFYRPLPRGALRWTDLLRFSLQGARLDLVTVVVTLLVGGLLGMVVPIVSGVVVGTVIPGADRSLLWQLVLGLLWTSVALAVLSLVQSVALNRMEQIMEAPLQAAVWDRLLDLPVSFFRRYSAGDLANRVMGVSALRRALTGAALTSILGLVMSFFNLCLLFWYDGGLAITAIGLLTVQTAVFLLALRLQVRRQRRVSEVQGQLSGLLLQLFGGISKLRVAGAESRAFGVWARRFARQSALQHDARRVATATASFDAAFGIVTTMLVYSVVAFGHVKLSTGAFISFTSALGSFLAAFLALNGALASVIAAIPSYERSLPILEATPEVEPTRARAPLLRGDVDLSHVTFRYTAEGQGREEREEGPLILSDVSIRARSGQFIAIVGPSGAGKSTIFRLLLGFETTQAGSVYMDGESLQYLDVQAVRSQIGVVLQSGRLMSGDIFHNIVGARALNLDDAWRAAEMAGIADEIRAMPMGMSTVVSEGAGNLSGGQRQRLLIARAVAGSPKILLFDEATSALDNYTQARVSEAIRRLPATRIVIAHRLSTVQDADCIYVLKDARVAESGTFDELMAAKGAFWELVERQLT